MHEWHLPLRWSLHTHRVGEPHTASLDLLSWRTYIKLIVVVGQRVFLIARFGPL